MIRIIRDVMLHCVLALALLVPAAAQTVPKFAVDPAWPQTLPNKWIIGTIGGITTFAILGLFGAPAGSSTLAEASTELLLAAPSVAFATYGVFLLVPVCATLLSVVTAHLAVMRQLRGA